jgi:hypothetical protein
MVINKHTHCNGFRHRTGGWLSGRTGPDRVPDRAGVSATGEGGVSDSPVPDRGGVSISLKNEMYVDLITGQF